MSNWNLSNLLTDLIKTRANQAGTPRREVWASEIGMPYLDRYLDMTGVPYSDLPDGKALLNFFLGEQLESGLKSILESLEIGFTDNERKEYIEKDYIPVIAKPDLIIEVDNWNKVKELIKTKAKALPDDKYKDRETEKLRNQYKVIERFETLFPTGLKKTIFEIKSCNSYAFKNLKREGAKPHHKLQLLTYLKAYDLEEGHIIYVNKEFGDMNEFVIRKDNERLNEIWDNDIKTMSYYIKNNIKPELNFDPNDWRFKYSKYYTQLYKDLYESEK